MPTRALILGNSETGKSTLAKYLAAELMREGLNVGVLDILASEDDAQAGAEWGGAYVTSDPDLFHKLFWETENFVWFIDEGGEVAGRGNDAMKWTATRGRHLGHSCYYIAHRLNVLDATLRAQCPRLYVFAVSMTDARDLADQFGAPELKEAPFLPVGQFYEITPGNRPQRYKINFDLKEITLMEKGADS